jgi:hypothetical protein
MVAAWCKHIGCCISLSLRRACFLNCKLGRELPTFSISVASSTRQCHEDTEHYPKATAGTGAILRLRAVDRCTPELRPAASSSESE